MPIAPRGKRLIILRLLTQHSHLTGGEMIDLEPDKLPDGTTYTTLRRLEQEKLVASWQDDTKGLPGLPRRFYEITALGRRAVAAANYAEAMFSGAIPIPR